MELRFPSSPSDNQATRVFLLTPWAEPPSEEEWGSISKIRVCPAPHPSTEHTPVYTGERGQTASAVQNVTPQGKDTPRPVPDS